MRRSAAVVLLFISSLLVLAVASPETTNPVKLPVLVSLFARVDDHMNIEMSEDRVRRVLALVAAYRAKYPSAGVSALVEFNGITSEYIASRNASTHLVDQLKKAQAEGAIDIGYNGFNEPTPMTRPEPSFRSVHSPEDRFLARETPIEWFLNEHKAMLTGEPDPNQPGGLKQTMAIFGPMTTVTGVITRELGGDTELVNVLQKQHVDAILPGIPEGSTWPARNLHGFSISSEQTGVNMGKPQCAAEFFWQDGMLRISDTSGGPVHIISGHAGAKGLKDVADKLDRTHLHLLRVQLAQDDIYANADFLKTWMSPSRYAYENPKVPNLPDNVRHSRADIDAAYAKEDELLRYVFEDFVPANPGSRIVALHELKADAVRAIPTQVSAASLRAMVADLFAQQKIVTTFPPSFLSDGKNYFSLAETFSLLANALAEKQKTGSIPESVTLRSIHGPLSPPLEMGPEKGEFTAEMVMRAAADMLPSLNDASWKPVPSNMVPGWVTVGNVKLTAAEYLTAMAEVYSGKTSLVPRRCNMFSAAGMLYPRTRDWSEEGFAWTLKPAVLDFTR